MCVFLPVMMFECGVLCVVVCLCLCAACLCLKFAIEDCVRGLVVCVCV